MTNPTPIAVRLIRGDAPDLARCLALRRRVFIVEQQVPEAEEVDGRDPACLHVLATRDGAVVGTARLRVTDQGVAKAERVAVHRELRGHGVGRRVMRALEAEAARQGHAAVVLGAQLDAVPFYERLGYESYGPVFLDAGIEHRMMRLSLVPAP